MAEHTLDREMRLASVGGAENGDEARGRRADRRVGHGGKVGEDGASRKRGNLAEAERIIPLPEGEGRVRGRRSRPTGRAQRTARGATSPFRVRAISGA
jgi:hypothetical protein